MLLRARRRRRAAAIRRGMTLLEVVIALSILGTALIGMAEYGRRYTRTNANASQNNQAIDLATQRIERVKAERNYTSMDTLAITENSIVGYPGYRRVTSITRVLTSQVDYKIVTVTVTRSTMPQTIKKTTAVASF